VSQVPLFRIAHARSGDKGDISNVGVIAIEARWYPVLLRELTPERVKNWFAQAVEGNVTRYELPNLNAVNFVMERALDGGGTLSLRVDAQGKTHAGFLLMMPIEVHEHELES
jgi:hypothetical protein